MAHRHIMVRALPRFHFDLVTIDARFITNKLSLNNFWWSLGVLLSKQRKTDEHSKAHYCLLPTCPLSHNDPCYSNFVLHQL
ncbi:hypothetical protein HC02_13155 [Vibrio parahaemolyticus]|nr:hypothetical protein HC02_13155 [Vibrio parahaemolyticus]